ncbi:MAG: PAS domain S-box protein [Gemmatimonadaceae bacterium]|nr:PAS domain S-box protein [Gemmatimonadaceae bacterium]NUR20143.1 PAS domain S-box protein [Gemmatimonadaceae bacterium]
MPASALPESSPRDDLASPGGVQLPPGADAALRLAEEHQRTALDVSAIGSWERDIDDGRVHWSETLERIHGLAPGTFGGTVESYQRLLHPEDRERVLAAMRAGAAGEDQHLVYRIVRPDGVVRWLEAHGRVIRDASGRPRRTIGIATDITERRKAEDRALLLAEAGRVIHGSLDREKTLETIVRLAVPALADWCVVDLLERQGAHRIVALHASPGKQPLLDELHRFAPNLERSDAPVARVIRSGRPLLIEQWTAQWTAAKATSAAHAKLLDTLEPRSAAIVPILGNDGAVLGAMSFFAADSGRRYGESDLRTAEALAFRASTALENARLYGEVVESRRLLEEQALELELQTQQLQDQATELESQRDELEQQAAEMEAVNEELHRVNEELVVANDATRATERFVRGILEAIADPFVVHDAEWRFRYINEAAGKTFARAGHDVNELVGRVLWEEYPDLIGTRFEERMRRASEAQTTVVFEEYYPKGGTWSEMRCYPLPDGGVATIWKDVTDQKRAEETLHYLSRVSEILGSSLDYENTVQSVAELVVPKLADWCAVDLIAAPGRISRIAVAHVDPQKVALAHALWERYPPNLDLPNGLGEVLRTGLPEMYPEIPDELLVAGAVDEEHLRISRELGLTSAIIVPLTAHERVLGAMTLASAESGRRYADPDLALAGEIARRAALAIDNARLYRASLAARDQLEQNSEELETINEELHAANLALAEKTRIADEARHAAEEANHAKAQFLAHMSHELRTPLNAIGGYAQLLEIGIHGPVNEAQLEALQRIQRSQRHLLGLINDVLNFAKLESGHVDYRIAPFPIAPLITGVEALVAPQLAAKSLRYECGGADAALLVDADPEKVQQILLNLLSNAIKFTGRGGLVRVSAVADGDDAVITVADSGIGVPSDKRDAIFEPFVQLARGSGISGHEGTGLGLAISRDLARAMQGDLTLRSSSGEGSVFEVRLPRA